MEPLDALDPAFLADPYPVYARLRDEDPVHRSAHGMWVLSRYDHVAAALRDPARFSSAPLNMGAPGFKFLIGSDPPDHTALRRLVNRPFHPNAVAVLEPRIREICASLVDDLLDANESGGADLVAQLGYPLPVIVIAELLGIPSERRADFKRWSDAMIGGLSPDTDRSGQAVAAMEMFAYFNEVIAERRTQPREDLISLLVSGREPLDNQELLMFCMLLLVAGNETTTNLVSNLGLVLLDRPDVEARLRADPAAIPHAVEEALRFDAPVQQLWRRTTVAVEIDTSDPDPEPGATPAAPGSVRPDGRDANTVPAAGGPPPAEPLQPPRGRAPRRGATVVVPAGEEVALVFASANRDPRRYAEADRFVLDRFAGAGVPDHLGFGAGIHLCLGAPLARLEARVAFEVLLDRTTAIEPAPPAERLPVRAHNVIVRGLRELPIRVTPRS